MNSIPMNQPNMSHLNIKLIQDPKQTKFWFQCPQNMFHQHLMEIHQNNMNLLIGNYCKTLTNMVMDSGWDTHAISQKNMNDHLTPTISFQDWLQIKSTKTLHIMVIEHWQFSCCRTPSCSQPMTMLRRKKSRIQQ